MSTQFKLITVTLLVLSLNLTFPTLTLAQEEPAVANAPIPALRYVLASPRAALLSQLRTCLSDLTVVPDYRCYLWAAAENFARKDGSLKIPAGTQVFFTLSRETEAIWYDNAFGLFATSLEIQLRVPNTDPSTSNAEAYKWVTLGQDAAKDIRKGPAIGRPKLKVRVGFNKPGYYVLRGIVTTTAQPYPPYILNQNDSLDNSIIPQYPGVTDKDVVYIKLAVLNAVPTDITPPEDATIDPDLENATAVPNQIDLTDPDLEADITGDGVVNLSDLAILAEQWGNQTTPIPDDDIE